MARELAAENEKLAADLQEIWKELDNVRDLFLQLQEKYDQCKGEFPIMRYRKLKAMIKDVIQPDIKLKLQSVSSDQDSSDLASGCKMFGDNMKKELEIKQKSPGHKKDDISVSKADIRTNNEHKQREKERLLKCARKTLIFLDTLQHSYQESKGRFPTQRYGMLKEMIKTSVREMLDSLQYVPKEPLPRVYHTIK